MTVGQPNPIESQPRKGVETETDFPFNFVTSTLSAPSIVKGTALADTAPTSTSEGRNRGDGRNRGENNKDDDRLDSTTEHVLISAASIGKFPCPITTIM